MRTPLISHNDFAKSKCVFSLLLLTFTSVSLIFIFRQNKVLTQKVIETELKVGMNTGFPPVTNQKIQTCVDLKNTCMGLWVTRQGSEWAAVKTSNSPPVRRKRERQGSGAASSSTTARDTVSSSSGSRGSSAAGSISFQSPPRAPIFSGMLRPCKTFFIMSQ